MTKKLHTTWIIEVRSPNTGAYGTNQDYYFRTEAEANTELENLRRWYGPDTNQTFTKTSHTWEQL